MPKKEGIQKLFDNIAPEYDRLNHIMSLNIDKTWRRRAVKRMTGTSNPLNILDIACGTGDFAIAIARKAPSGSRITGLDISSGMIEIGREKVAKAGLSKTVSLEQGDSEDIQYGEGTFDRVSVAFGVRNFENMDKGLKEMYRVLKKDGKIVILELSVPQNRLMRWFYNLYFVKILPKIGGKVSGDRGAYEYLPASVLNFPKPDRFKAMMAEAGFANIRHKSFTFGICRMFTADKQPL